MPNTLPGNPSKECQSRLGNYSGSRLGRAIAMFDKPIQRAQQIVFAG